MNTEYRFVEAEPDEIALVVSLPKPDAHGSNRSIMVAGWYLSGVTYRLAYDNSLPLTYGTFPARIVH